MKARRCQCAVPGCTEDVFPTMREARTHLREIHGIRLEWPNYEDGLVMLDPRRAEFRRGSSKNYVPSPEEYERVLDEARDDMDHVIFNTLGEAGLRVNELLHIRRYWIEDGKLVIPAADPGTGFTAKTRMAARTVPIKVMSRSAWLILRDWFEERKEIGVCATTVWDRVRKAGRRADLRRKLFPHALRARCATLWAYRVNNVTVLQDVFGWETPQVAQRYIAHSGGQAERAFREWRLQNG